MSHHEIPFLTLLIIVPAVGGVALALLGLGGKLSKELGDWLAMLVSLATLVIAVLALVTMKQHFGGFQLVSDHTYTGETRCV